MNPEVLTHRTLLKSRATDQPPPQRRDSRVSIRGRLRPRSHSNHRLSIARGAVARRHGDPLTGFGSLDRCQPTLRYLDPYGDIRIGCLCRDELGREHEVLVDLAAGLGPSNLSHGVARILNPGPDDPYTVAALEVLQRRDCLLISNARLHGHGHGCRVTRHELAIPGIRVTIRLRRLRAGEDGPANHYDGC